VSIYLDFEKPVAQIAQRAADYRAAGDDAGARHAEGAARRLLAETYARLSPWQKTLVARHPARPHFSDIAKALVEDFTPLAGDRAYGEDLAILGGLGKLRGLNVPVMLIGHEKGNDTASRVRHNFGMGRPEGYRKAARLVELAARFNVPVITLVDSAGAYPGVDGEARGQPGDHAGACGLCRDFAGRLRLHPVACGRQAGQPRCRCRRSDEGDGGRLQGAGRH
jgi:acetyl-CoA carboxylase carboxyl transferase subunit alpha